MPLSLMENIFQWNLIDAFIIGKHFPMLNLIDASIIIGETFSNA